MNIAIIIAGGVGQRVGKNIPKQFIKVNRKPIIVYSLINAQKCSIIDAIVVVVKNGWEDEIKKYAVKYRINKLKDVITGGDTRHASVNNGVMYAAEHFSEDDNLILFDANRPLIPQYVIEEGVKKLAATNGSVVSVQNCYDTMYRCVDGAVKETVDRTILFKGQAPEFIKVGEAEKIYGFAEKDGIKDMTTTQLMLYYGKDISCSVGSPLSFKITVEEDIDLFKAMVKLKKIK